MHYKELIKKPIEYMKKVNRTKKKIYTTFLRGLIQRKVRSLDSLALALHQESFEKIDCLECANCCKTMSPTYKKSDVNRIAHHLGMTYKEYFKKYLYVDETGDIMNRKTPCQFLQKDNKCSVYDIRPVDCHGFPHTHNKEFKLYISGTHIQNISYCPITLHIVERMHEIIIEKGKRNLKGADIEEIVQ